MTNFGALEDVEPTSAWPHEARDFTPWLAANLGRLGEALGIELELVSTESRLPTDDDRFSVDIHAVNISDSSTVLIENQLTTTDHTHLGQILTYVAGLEAKSLIWIAPQFRKSHLAAIRWLNMNTSEIFSFFAVKLRVVKIGASPFAPLFEILEQPNNWQRHLRSNARTVESNSELTAARAAFWQDFNLRFPSHELDSGNRHSNRYKLFKKGVIGYYIADGEAGIYVRARNGIPAEDLVAALSPFSKKLSEQLGCEFNPESGWLFPQRISLDFRNPNQSVQLGDWLDKKVSAYKSTLDAIYENLE